MPTKQHEKRDTEPDSQDRKQFHDQIGKQVIQTLGKPGDLHMVQVRRLWGTHFRVNILVGTDSINARYTHSYFLTIDADGTILSSTPEITKQY